jgi:hypothetical protein
MLTFPIFHDNLFQNKEMGWFNVIIKLPLSEQGQRSSALAAMKLSFEV